MSNLVCSICGAPLENGHPYRDHKITIENYVYKYHPKTNLLTEQPIKWKNSLEAYFLSDFDTKTELNKWLKTQTNQKVEIYLKEKLKQLKEIKQINFIPTQVELRSRQQYPGISTFNKYFDYYQYCESIGYISRGFVNLNNKTIFKSSRNLRGNPILVDSRESNYLSFGNKEIQVTTMGVGDYTIKNNNYNIVIERKEISDGISTLSSGYERFRKELIRAQESNTYVIMLFESPINDFLNFNYLPWISKKIQATPGFVTHRLRLLLQEFPLNFQVGFCNGRGHMKEIILKIFEMEDKAKFFDVQLALDLDLLSNKI